MLGRVRASPSSLDCLELERPPSKLIKSDALSIYVSFLSETEATLEKLRLGSRRALSSSSEEAMKIDSPSSSISASPSFSDGQSHSVKSSNKEMEDMSFSFSANVCVG
ncbi:hypothetical protein IFM89_006428 [Coptis chinensis]|uniref:Uncharacterized protein n=1 Tax=Coptis chinensis TaxID=261450 RepID=A0A835LV39_9MAGN|nr:hypothetical protein IFM89_006428 [Coptis chinensis]